MTVDIEKMKALALAENLDQQDGCNSALRAEPASQQHADELARAWMMSHGYGNQSVVYALADLQSRIEAKDREGVDLVHKLMTAQAKLDAATRCRVEGGGTSADVSVINYGDLSGKCTAPAAGTEKDAERLKSVIFAALENNTTDMESYSYFDSNPGVPTDRYDDVADEVIAAIAALGQHQEKP